MGKYRNTEVDLDLSHFSGPSSESLQTKYINFQKMDPVSKWKFIYQFQTFWTS